MPSIDLLDISDNPEEAKGTLEAFRKNLPQYVEEQGAVPLFTKRDEWEMPPLDTAMRIFGRKKDNTTPQVVETIRRVANYNLK